EETISQTGFVRKWYEVIKSATGSGLVSRMFATGVSPLTLDGLTSGFNISKNKSMDVRFNECLGFTEEEVKSVLEQSLGKSIDIEKEMPVLKKYYNGYLFSENGKRRIFNSDMILYYASEYSGSGLPPKQLIDNNIASDYMKLAMLFYLKNKEQNLAVLKEITEGKTQNTVITSEFSLSKRFHRDDFTSLLFYLGFLTIEKSRPTSLDLNVPNYVIKELYFDFFGELLKKEADYDIDVSKIRQAIEKNAIEGELKDF
ncbi:AAA family ATPase, partial [Herbivorax sp. ANBcel31]|uniref:AAA family ATPase n=1 Tax=Herbivorax sp. ANBcel31 TaxID=3069754 RepID=UPI0027B81255